MLGSAGLLQLQLRRRLQSQPQLLQRVQRRLPRHLRLRLDFSHLSLGVCLCRLRPCPCRLLQALQTQPAQSPLAAMAAAAGPPQAAAGPGLPRTIQRQRSSTACLQPLSSSGLRWHNGQMCIAIHNNHKFNASPHKLNLFQPDMRTCKSTYQTMADAGDVRPLWRRFRRMVGHEVLRGCQERLCNQPHQFGQIAYIIRMHHCSMWMRELRAAQSTSLRHNDSRQNFLRFALPLRLHPHLADVRPTTNNCFTVAVCNVSSHIQIMVPRTGPELSSRPRSWSTFAGACMVQLRAKGHLNMRAGNQLAAHNLGHAPGVLGLTLWGDGTQYCLRVAVSNYTNQ